jgi:hypothetical protein
VIEQLLQSDWGLFLLVFPLLCTLQLGLLRFEARALSGRRRRAPVPGMGTDDGGREFLTDPDGRHWYPARRAR